MQGSAGSGADISFYNTPARAVAPLAIMVESTSSMANAGRTFTNHPAPRTGGSARLALSITGVCHRRRATFIMRDQQFRRLWRRITVWQRQSLGRCTAINYGASVRWRGDTADINGTAADEQLIAYGGTNGGDGGVIQFAGSASSDNAQVQVYGNGN
jgi:hypothetical protein